MLRTLPFCLQQIVPIQQVFCPQTQQFQSKNASIFNGHACDAWLLMLLPACCIAAILSTAAARLVRNAVSGVQ
jgi:hypothetical protein